MLASSHLHRNRVRQPACAGRFYAGTAEALRRQIEECRAGATATTGPVPTAVIVPHAGYIYSGPVAASAYARLGADCARFQRVALLGPAHCLPVEGVVASSAAAFATPLGEAALDVDAIQTLIASALVKTSDEAHAPEHCLEVQLPFLQTILGDFSIIPLLVGRATDQTVAEVIERVWDDRTLILVSSDLSHYHSYAEAAQIDGETAARIETLSEETLMNEHACGARPIRGLLQVARKRGLKCRRLDLRNSGDTAGPRDRVVGYGAFAFTEYEKGPHAPQRETPVESDRANSV